VLRADRPVPVTEDGEVIGVIDVERLLPALIGHQSQVPA
jgi:glycine betaine/proline transport system ATP-binding protein